MEQDFVFYKKAKVEYGIISQRMHIPAFPPIKKTEFTELLTK